MVEFQCAVAAAEREEAVFATASQVHRWLLVEVRGSWGKDVVADTDLADHVPAGWAAKLKAHGVRPVAIRRDLQLDRDDEEGVTLFYAEAGHGPLRPGALWSRTVGGLHDVAAATADIGEQALHVGPPGWERLNTGLLLVCTNGRHDSCCATFGRPLVRHLRDTPAAPYLWECTHVGGDRFAANLVVLPDSIYFGRVTTERVGSLLDAYRRRRLDLELYRGRSTLPYIAQAAEYFARRELELDAIDAVLDVHQVAPGCFRLEIAAEGSIGTREVEVVVERARVQAPTPLTCTGPQGVSYPTYRLVSLEITRPGATPDTAG